MRERLALAIMHLIGRNFVHGQSPWTLPQFTQHLGIPMYSINIVLDALAGGGLVIQSNDDLPAYLPARDLSQVPVSEVLTTIRKAGEDAFVNPDSLPLPASVEKIVQSLECAIVESTAVVTVADMVAGTEPVRTRPSTASGTSSDTSGQAARTFRIG
ncbi:MAG: hypothetical protein ACREX6_04615 [Casimicrobiaceae bacterium]